MVRGNILFLQIKNSKSVRKKIILATDKGERYYEKIFDYQVARPMAVVSPTKMNVFYKGVPNPIDVSVPGFSQRIFRFPDQEFRLKK